MDYNILQWKLRNNYKDFSVQTVNNLIIIIATDTRDNNKYIVGQCLPKDFTW